jgi:hypothetical protein
VRWTVPLLVRFGEYGCLVWIGALANAEPAAFLLVAALALHQYDMVYGRRYRGALPSIPTGGWDGRIAVAGVILAVGALPGGFYALAAIIALVAITAAIRDWSMTRRHG